MAVVYFHVSGTQGPDFCCMHSTSYQTARGVHGAFSITICVSCASQSKGPGCRLKLEPCRPAMPLAPTAGPQQGPAACAQVVIDQDNAQILLTDMLGSSSAFDLPSMAGVHQAPCLAWLVSESPQCLTPLEYPVQPCCPVALLPCI